MDGDSQGAEVVEQLVVISAESFDEVKRQVELIAGASDLIAGRCEDLPFFAVEQLVVILNAVAAARKALAS